MLGMHKMELEKLSIARHAIMKVNSFKPRIRMWTEWSSNLQIGALRIEALDKVNVSCNLKYKAISQ